MHMLTTLVYWVEGLHFSAFIFPPVIPSCMQLVLQSAIPKTKVIVYHEW